MLITKINFKHRRRRTVNKLNLTKNYWNDYG